MTLDLNPRSLTISDIYAHWSAKVEDWKGHRLLNPSLINLIQFYTDQVLSPIINGGPILDLCSGAEGINNYSTLVKQEKICAIDISKLMLVENPATSKIQTDVRVNLPLAEEQFAAVTMFFGWGHLHYGRQYHDGYVDAEVATTYSNVLGEIYRVLIPGGLLIIVDTPRGNYEIGERIMVRQFKYRTVEIFAERTGFENIESGNLFFTTNEYDPNLVSEVDFLNAKKPSLI